MIAYKLFREMKDGSIAPLFMNMRQRLTIGVEYPAEYHPKVGFAMRMGWHCTTTPTAPHLSMKGRAWYEVEVSDFTYFNRPKSQGGVWILANKLTVIKRIGQ